MATTNHTPTIELSQYASTDKTSYLVNYNDDMLKIDGAIAADRDDINTAQNTADTAEGKADTNKLSIDAINLELNDPTTGLAPRVAANASAINTINSLIGNGEPTTTDKTIIGAINELNGNVGDITQLSTANKNNVVEAINECDADIVTLMNTTGEDFTTKCSSDFASIVRAHIERYGKIAVVHLEGSLNPQTIGSNYTIATGLDIKSRASYQGLAVQTLNNMPCYAWVDSNGDISLFIQSAFTPDGNSHGIEITGAFICQ